VFTKTSPRTLVIIPELLVRSAATTLMLNCKAPVLETKPVQMELVTQFKVLAAQALIVEPLHSPEAHSARVMLFIETLLRTPVTIREPLVRSAAIILPLSNSKLVQETKPVQTEPVTKSTPFAILAQTAEFQDFQEATSARATAFTEIT